MTKKELRFRRKIKRELVKMALIGVSFVLCYVIIVILFNAMNLV